MKLDTRPKALVKFVPPPFGGLARMVLEHIRQGRFQRSLSLMVAATSAVSGLEVGYEHYRGSYSNPVMYTPVILSGALTVAGAAAVFSRRAAETWMRWLSWLTLLDGLVGFGFHIRGIARKPGGWRMPVTNIVMGPPLFAPLLFGTSAYLGVLASYLQREGDSAAGAYALDAVAAAKELAGRDDWRDDIRVGRFQKHFCVVVAAYTVCVGAESWYSHFKNNFEYKVQWSPILLTPLLSGAALGALKSERIANTLLPAASAVAMLDGVVGTYFHVRGILKKPGGRKKPLYNTLYGPPIFAPMLFAAAGMLGMMAYLVRRERTR